MFALTSVSVYADKANAGKALDRRQLLAVPALISAALFLQRPAWGATTGTCYRSVNLLSRGLIDKTCLIISFKAIVESPTTRVGDL